MRAAINRAVRIDYGPAPFGSAPMIDGTELAALASAKICHDIMGPISVLVQAIETLKANDSNGRNAEEIAVLDEGLHKMWAKLDFFRFAFAGATAEGEGQLEEARDTAEKMFAHLKPSLVWSAANAPMPKAAVRVVANLLLIASDCLPRGGTVELVSDTQEVRVVATGDRAKLKPDVAAALRGERPEMGFMGASIPPLLTGVAARANGVEIEPREGDGRVEFAVRTAAHKARAA